MNTDLTKEQKDYAIFLPAISGAFANFIGNQKANPNYVPANRMPNGIPDMDMLNFLDPKNGLYQYKYGLYSAGHANLDLTKNVPAEYMLRHRDPSAVIVADSGGFQIGKGKWKADWANPNCPRAMKYRTDVFKWLSSIGTYSMVLDVPVWTAHDPEGSKNTNIKTYQQAVDATIINNDYFITNNTGQTKFLNVLQGSNHTESDAWYDIMKHYNDKNKHKHPFEGWAIGGNGAADYHLLLKRIVTIIHDDLLGDWFHVLGIGKMTHGVVLTEIQRAIRKEINPNFTLSYDAASPFLQTANGGIYVTTNVPCNSYTKNPKPWSYVTERTIDNKLLTNDTRDFRTAVIQDGINPRFTNSPITERLTVKDICVYSPTCFNKIKKQGKTAWDTFSYALFMCHNVWAHVDATQLANRVYDTGCMPGTLVDSTTGITFKDIIEELFSTTDLKKQYKILDNHSKFFMNIKGVKSFGGKKVMNASTSFNNLFA